MENMHHLEIVPLLKQALSSDLSENKPFIHHYKNLTSRKRFSNIWGQNLLPTGIFIGVGLLS
jgi:hypothetical protein